MITWAEIETECGDYKAGFVAAFRKYEGQPTDEKDAYNRTVKVTVESFARHVGIDGSTFRRWVKMAGSMSTISDPKRPAIRARSMVRNDPQAVVDAIMEAPEETREAIFHEVKQRRAGIDTSPANRKAAEAFAAEAVAPLKRAVTGLAVATIADALDATTDVLDQAIHDVPAADLAAMLPGIREAWHRLGGVLEIAEALTGVNVS
jgi:hypothetical protein